MVSCGSPAGESQTDGVGVLDHRIFVSSMSYSGDLGGLSGADQKCRSLAAAAGLSRSYKAVLSSDSELAKDRLDLTGAVYKFDSSGGKTMLAEVGVDLWSSNLLAAPDKDESGQDVSGMIWTGTDSDGGNFGATLDNCSDWTSSASADDGAVGDSGRVNGLWLEEIASMSCDTPRPIYCISQ